MSNSVEKAIDNAINNLVVLLSGRLAVEQRDTSVPSTGICGVPGFQSYILALRDLSGITHEFPYPAEIILRFAVEIQHVDPKKKKAPPRWVVNSVEEISDSVFYMHIPKDCFGNIGRLSISLSSSTGLFKECFIYAPLQEVFSPNVVQDNPYHHLVLDFDGKYVAQLFFRDATTLSMSERNRLEILMSGQRYGCKTFVSPVVGSQFSLISHQQTAMRQWLQDTDDLVTLVNGVSESFPSLTSAGGGTPGKGSPSMSSMAPQFNGVFQASAYWKKTKAAKEPSELVLAPVHRLKSSTT